MPTNLQDSARVRRQLAGLMTGLGLLLACVLPLAAQLDYAEKVTSPGQVVIDSRGIFTLGGISEQDLAARTALVQSRLNRILSAQATAEPVVSTGRVSAGWTLKLNDQLLVTLTPQDTGKHNTSAQALAEEWAASLRTVLKDRTLLATHLEFNSAPEWVSLNGLGYVRTDKQLASDLKPASSGYLFRRNLIFVAGDSRPPEQVYLRAWNGGYVVYDRLRDPLTESTPQ